jgi:AraC-like DNA-binding protein
MEIVCLLGEARARLNLRGSLPHPRWAPHPWKLSFLNSWRDLERESSANLDSVLVVDPFRGNRGHANLEDLERVTVRRGNEAVVLYLSRRATRIRSTASASLKSRFPILLKLGQDDHPAHLLCALSAARSSARFAEVWHSMALHVPPEGNGLLRSIFVHWPRASAVADLAKRLGSSERRLRRSMRRNGLPPPSEILRAVHLLDAVSLRELGVVASSNLAALLGYSDSYSLSRSCRNLIGVDIGELLESGGTDQVVRTVAAHLRT